MPAKEKKEFSKLDFFKKEIDNATDYQKSWESEAKKYLDIYRDQHNLSIGGESRRYNIFWANTQTLKPLVYSNLPNPNVTRRFLNEDENARIASELIERSLNFFLEDGSSNVVFNKVRDDFLIVGRGLARVYINPAEVVEIEEENELGEIEVVEDLDLSTKKVGVKYVCWDDLVISPEKEWDKVRWVAFRHKLNRDQLVEKFGEKGKKVNLDSTILVKDKDDFSSFAETESFQVAEVWEYWDKESKRVTWFTNSTILEDAEDTYNLKDFFPIARPVGSDSDPASLLPIPLYRMYKSQAEELNEIDSRIKSLVQQCKFTGVYNSIGENQDIKSFLNGVDGQFTPMKTISNANIKDSIYTKPLNEIITTIAQLNDQKARVIQNIRDITGLSDIVRGTTLASETATAQRLKGDFAISRIQPLQREFAVFVRNTVRLMAELITENYSIEELAKITNLQIVDVKAIEEQAITQAQALIQQANPQTPEEQEELNNNAKLFVERSLKKPLNDLKGYAATPEQLGEVDSLIKDDINRQLMVDIETDSTISIDQNQQKQDRFEYVQAISNFTNSFFPLVQAGIITPSAFNEFLAFISRPFKVGRNLEEHLLSQEEIGEEPEGPSIEEQLAQAENARKDQELKLKAQEVNIKQQLANVEKAKIKVDIEQFNDKLEFEDANKEADRRAKTTDELIQSRTDRVTSLIRESDLLNQNAA
jgi:hypothetical protein